MKRILIQDVEPKGYNAMLHLDGYGEKLKTISKSLKTLIKLRASQLNHCTYCIDMHVDEAGKIDETRINEVENWQTSNVFTNVEKLALKLTEEITFISQHGVSDEVYIACIKTFGETVTAQLIMLIVIINSWNRIGITTKMKY